jgi:hypothetical protein
MLAGSSEFIEPKSNGRSRVTNGSHVLPGIDGRSTWARRFRDLMALHISDLGGDEHISEAQRSIVRRTATLEVQLERLELKFALADPAQPVEAVDLDLYQRASNTMRRHLETLGIKRISRDVTPDIGSYVARAAQGA